MTRGPLLCVVALLAACGSDALTAGREALDNGDHATAVTKLRAAVDEAAGDADRLDLYRKALSAYLEDLRRPTIDVAACDDAVATLSKISGFADGDRALDGEGELFTQAVLCAARHRARQKQPEEAAKVVVEAIARYPGLAPGSPVLAKALRQPAERRARARDVAGATALAQVIFSSGDHGRALAILDLLEASGAGSGDIYPVLAQRATQSKTSDAAAAVAASFATWHDHPAEAARWFDEIAERASKDGSARAKSLKRWADLRGAEASRLAAFTQSPCTVEKAGIAVASKVPAVPAFSAAGTDGGVLVAWIEGEAAPAQSLKVARVAADGTPGDSRTISDSLPRAKAAGADVIAAYAPKNREPALALVRCGGTIEVAVRGAPSCSWARATLADDGQVSSSLTEVPPLAESSHLPNEDVWWNVGCSNDKLVHIWLADTQLMRIAWFDKGVPLGAASNMKLPGFSPWFVATSAPDNGTRLIWIDIMGEGMSQILGTVIPEDREIPLGEDETNAAAEQIVKNIDGRVEHMRLTEVADRLALTYHPKQGDIMVRWMERESGKLLGSEGSIVRLREDAQKVRFDAAANGDRLGLAWTELQTDDAATLYFQTVGADGNEPSRPQRVAGLLRPDLSPVLVPVGDRWAIAYADRSEPGGEALDVAMIRCGR